MPTLRQTNGLSGFTKRSESDYDSFGTGHSSTSISAGLGMLEILFPLSSSGTLPCSVFFMLIEVSCSAQKIINIVVPIYV